MIRPEVMMTANRIALREYDSLAIGSRWDPGRKTVSRQQAAAIDAYQTRVGVRFFEIGLRSIKATNWVGSFGLGKHCLDVVPKIDLPYAEDSRLPAMENLLYMVSIAGLVPFTPSEISRLVNSGKPLISGFLDLYVTNLAREWIRGPVRQYVSVESHRPYLRGKLVFSRHLRENAVHKERFFTVSDEFIADNPVSRLLKSALTVCERQRLSEDAANRARPLLGLFDDVSGWNPSPGEIKAVSVDRSIARYGHLVSLAKLILSEVSPAWSESGEPVYSLMFDMNSVFEGFVASELKGAMLGSGCTVKEQISGKSLLLRNGKKVFHLRPDLGVISDNSVVCLLDTKWKVLDPSRPYDKVSQSDMYQMYAYGKEYNAPAVILLYPHARNLSELVAVYDHRNSGGDDKKHVIVRTVNVSKSLAIPENRTTLRNYLKDIVLEVKEQVSFSRA